ncbi:Bug family tripartite tricarboxylate transporter substrate binding protein [Bosea caraganae]|nr:tripartite tricarboxylate transporter substrate-binding protein [Bosea caraganae]
MRSDRRSLLIYACQIGLLAGLPGRAQAASWPAKPVTIVVPYGAGGGADILGRILAEELSIDLKERFLVENKAGMSGSLGVGYAAKSAPDGYTFVLCTVGAQITNPFLYKKLPYDPMADLVPVVHLTTPPNILVAHASLGVSTVKELIALGKTRAEPLLFATTGTGSSSNLSAELFKSMAGIKITPVAYQSSAQAALDLTTGRVHATIDSLTSMINYTEAGGQLKLLAVATRDRLANYEKVPTIGETLPGFDASPLLYISAPTGTPPDIVATLNTAINKIISRPAIAAKLLGLGYPVGGGTAQDLAAIIEEERKKWRAVIVSAGLMATE